MSRVVAMTRRVSFSSGHRFWLESLSLEENRARFGSSAGPFNHGHNYVLDVTVEGQVDPADGMVLNIKRIDDLLRDKLLSQLDNRSLNDEVEEFRHPPPTLENLMGWIQARVSTALPSQVVLSGLRLEESPLVYGEMNGSVMTITRVYEFAAAHRLYVPELSPEENWERFGKCTNPAGHGHNYVLEVTVRGEADPMSGMLVNQNLLDAAVQDLVIDRYDHKNLNVDIEELNGLNPTSEIVALAIFDRLKGKLPAELYRVRLHETARNSFEVTSEAD